MSRQAGGTLVKVLATLGFRLGPPVPTHLHSHDNFYCCFRKEDTTALAPRPTSDPFYSIHKLMGCQDRASSAASLYRRPDPTPAADDSTEKLFDYVQLAFRLIPMPISYGYRLVLSQYPGSRWLDNRGAKAVRSHPDNQDVFSLHTDSSPGLSTVNPPQMDMKLSNRCGTQALTHPASQPLPITVTVRKWAPSYFRDLTQALCLHGLGFGTPDAALITSICRGLRNIYAPAFQIRLRFVRVRRQGPLISSTGNSSHQHY
ncbi:hypothetical protein B0T19DRAFT_284391 [Cercophora scortea]|uniref:Uncharacterized protein n=1 Tax=Cercophora scortea TaxID=314031 RepID=A0AAE0M6E0_9PEZI|nr:hypothetical protein B0T19DRAFT_284391 [Cercophora scortea]